MLYNADIAAISSTRDMLCRAITERGKWEIAEAAKEGKTPDDIETKLKYLTNFHAKCERADAFTLGYLATRGSVAFETVFQSHKRSNAAYNIYAMPKALLIARCLNGSSLELLGKGDHVTIAGVLLAMAAGETRQRMLAAAIDKLASTRGNLSYRSGATQASSTLRALETFGIVKSGARDESNTQTWHPGNPELFARMVDAANGKRAESVTEAADIAARADDGGSATKRDRSASRATPRAAKGKRKEGVAAATPATPTPEGETPASGAENPASDDAGFTLA